MRVRVSAVVGFTVLDNTMSPFPATPCVDSWIPVVSTIAFANLIAAFVVVMFDPRLLVPPPLCVIAPVDISTAPPAVFVVKSPEFVTVVVPPTIHAASTVRLFPIKAKLPV